MIALNEIQMTKRLHFWRKIFFVFVSVWITSSAFGLENKPETKAKTTTVNKYEALKAQVEKDPTNSKVAVELAHLHFAKKEFEQTATLLWKHIDSLKRKDLQVLLRCHAELMQGDQLLRVANLLISQNPKDYEALHYQGRAYLLNKKEKEALESFKQSINANKKYLPSYLAIGDFYESKKNLYELRNLYQDMLHAFGPRAEILKKLCQFNTQDGLNETAEKYCRQATQVDPSIPENHVNLGIVLVQTGEKEKGKYHFKKTVEKFPKSELALFQYGNLLEQEKNYIEAYKIFKSCVEAEEGSERCQLGFANSAFQIQKYQEAHDAYKKLCKKNRSYGVHVRRGLASLRSAGQNQWSNQFESLSEYCSL